MCLYDVQDGKDRAQDEATGRESEDMTDRGEGVCSIEHPDELLSSKLWKGT